MPEPKEYLTLKEAAQILSVDPLTLRRWIRRGLLQAVRLPTARSGWRVPRYEIERLLARKEGAPDGFTVKPPPN